MKKETPSTACRSPYFFRRPSQRSIGTGSSSVTPGLRPRTSCCVRPPRGARGSIYPSATTNGYEAAASPRISSRSSRKRKPAAMVASRDASKRSQVLVLPPGVQRRQGRVVEGFGAAEEHGEGLPALARGPPITAVGHVDPRGADPATGEAVTVEAVAGPLVVELQPRRRRGRLAAGRPLRQVGQRSLCHVVLLGAGVDRRVRLADHEVRRGAQQLGHALRAQACRRRDDLR